MREPKLKVTAHHLLALATSILFILPLYWAFVASLRQTGLPPPRSVAWWPSDPQWQNYATLFEIVPMVRYTVNSLIVVVISVPITLLTSSAAGFALTQIGEKWRRRLFGLSIVFLIIPGAALWIFRYQIFDAVGLLDRLGSLIVPAVGASSPLFVLLYYWTFRRVPVELVEAARLDGATATTIWRRVVMPLAWPTTTAVALLTFILYWNDFVSPVLYLFEPRNYTLPVGIQIINQLDRTNWPLLMAASIYATIPVLIVFFYLQRYFLKDLSIATLLDRN